MQDVTVHGLWSTSQCLHISHLELLAIQPALKAFHNHLHNKVVLLRTDMTAMHYVKKPGVRGKSSQLSFLAERIYHWAIHHKICLVEYLPEVDNNFADMLSRTRQHVDE